MGMRLVVYLLFNVCVFVFILRGGSVPNTKPNNCESKKEDKIDRIKADDIKSSKLRKGKEE